LRSPDGYDTIAWCAEQPWSNGAVGMFGVSYVGTLAWFAATARPPNLVTILPTLAAFNAHDGWVYRGGAFELGFNLSLTLLFFALDAASRRQEGVEGVAEKAVHAIDGLPTRLWRRLLTDQPELRDIAPYYFDWLEYPDSDSYWRPFAIDHLFGSVDLPAFHVGGWYDIFLNGTLANFVGMQSTAAATNRARASQKLPGGPLVSRDPVARQPRRRRGFRACLDRRRH
jgi:putative CocE/NonD family hydrolase